MADVKLIVHPQLKQHSHRFILHRNMKDDIGQEYEVQVRHTYRPVEETERTYPTAPHVWPGDEVKLTIEIKAEELL